MGPAVHSGPASGQSVRRGPTKTTPPVLLITIRFLAQFIHVLYKLRFVCTLKLLPPRPRDTESHHDSPAHFLFSQHQHRSQELRHFRKLDARKAQGQSCNFHTAGRKLLLLHCRKFIHVHLTFFRFFLCNYVAFVNPLNGFVKFCACFDLESGKKVSTC